jgi:hypothetical protein
VVAGKLGYHAFHQTCITADPGRREAQRVVAVGRAVHLGFAAGSSCALCYSAEALGDLACATQGASAPSVNRTEGYLPAGHGGGGCQGRVAGWFLLSGAGHLGAGSTGF